MRSTRIAIGAALVGLSIAGWGTDVHAAEAGKGFYLLGSRAHMAGIMPGPGSYFANDFYFYDGGAGNTVDFPIGDLIIDGGLDATVAIDLMTGLHVLPTQFLGGSVAIGLTVPVGWQEISARGKIQDGGAGLSTSDDDFEFGDPVLVAALGWHHGNMHWQLGGLLNVPIGSYSENDLVNLGFNRWAFDLTGSATYLDMATGIEMSGALGFTFNGENLDTGYQSGTELHAEFAASKLFANGMS
ncbi:MAG: transporter, partial [Anderseniella sp.]|nr:transporter [Anderseniella sp.]